MENILKVFHFESVVKLLLISMINGINIERKIGMCRLGLGKQRVVPSLAM